MKALKSALWDSPISSKSIFESRKTISNLQPWKDGLLFLITEPSEGNINVLMYSDTNSVTNRVSPKGINIRSKVHEYGGRPFIASGNDIYYCNFDDQEIYTQSIQKDSNSFSKPTAVTDSLGDNVRYVDLTFDKSRNRLIAVREDHRKTNGYEAKNSLIALQLSSKEFPKGLEKQTILQVTVTRQRCTACIAPAYMLARKDTAYYGCRQKTVHHFRILVITARHSLQKKKRWSGCILGFTHAKQKASCPCYLLLSTYRCE